MTAVALRQPTGHTLASLADRLAEQADASTTTDVPLSDIEFRLADADPHFVVGERSIPSTMSGILAFGDFLGVPSPFLQKFTREAGPDGAQYVLDRLLTTTQASAASVTYTDGAVRTVRDVGQRPIDPLSIVRVATRVIGADSSEVVRLVDEPGVFSFDATVPADYDRAVGGDRAVGDITTGGLRFGQDRKRNLAPWTQPYIYRLWCTNGITARDDGLRVDARGLTVDEVLAELEAAAERAFSRVEGLTAGLYALREHPVDNPERTIRAIAREQAIPPRSVVRLMDLAASDALPDSATMFDVVNLVTNLANHVTVRNDGGRTLLEAAGGAVVSDEAARCGHCRQRVVTS